MSENETRGRVPERLLLATDLSARSDRALDRAAQLAGEWQAELIAMNVVDPGLSPDQILAWAAGADDVQLVNIARQQLRRDLEGLGIRATMVAVRSRDEVGAIGEMAARHEVGLVITGVARNETLGRFLLGSTVKRLARSLNRPLLVVRNRGRGAYRRVVVASDFSDSSRFALETALRLFPGKEVVLFHAYEAPMSGLSDHPSESPISRESKNSECKAFLDACELPPGAVVRCVIEMGGVENCLAAYVREHDVDLVAIGTHGRSGLKGIMLGSTASRLLDWLPSDVLLVRKPGGAS